VVLEGRAGSRRIKALVHHSGSRRERRTVEQAIAQRLASLPDGPLTPDQYMAVLADITGLPTDPIRLDEQGREVARPRRRAVS
jgi:hypothetical protein